MKFLIWFVCVFVAALIQVFISNAGVILGAIPMMLLYGGTFAIARALCRAWDTRKAEKKPQVLPEGAAAPLRQAQPGEWICPKCGNVHAKDVTVCWNCKTDKLDALRGNVDLPKKTYVRKERPGDWTCPNCGTVLDKEMDVCWKCRLKKQDAKRIREDREKKPYVREERPGDWTCPGCGTVLDKEIDNCWKCGMKKLDALRAVPRTPAVPEIQPQAVPQVKEGGWFCSECGTAMAKDDLFCGNCGQKKEVSFGIPEPREEPDPVVEPGVTQPLPQEPGEAPQPAEKPGEEAPRPEEPPREQPKTEPAVQTPIPRYVRFLEKQTLSGWDYYTYRFVTYDYDFALKCLQAIVEEKGSRKYVTRVPAQGEPERDCTQALENCGWAVRECRELAQENDTVAAGGDFLGADVKTFLRHGSSAITVVTVSGAEQRTVDDYINSVIDRAVKS